MKRATPRTAKANTDWPPIPPVKPKTKDKKFSQRTWNRVRADDDLRLFAIDLNFIKRKRPKAMWRIMEKALRRCDLCTQASARFPGLDIYSPQVVYYFRYCICTRPRTRNEAGLKPIFAFEIARRVFHSILMEEGQGTARVQRTFDAYSEMYGFKQGPRTMFNRAPEDKPESIQEESGQVVDIRQRKLENLREELNEREEHAEVEDEGAIFRLKRIIHELEYEIDQDKWPDIIGEGGEQ